LTSIIYRAADSIWKLTIMPCHPIVASLNPQLQGDKSSVAFRLSYSFVLYRTILAKMAYNDNDCRSGDPALGNLLLGV
jgi:hypothetical protein